MPYEYYARFTRIIDGDTGVATIELGFQLSTTQTIRFLGINCPEVHGDSKVAGLAAADYTRSRLLDKDVVLRTHSKDSFGRWLGTIILDGVDFNQELVTAGHAIPFMVGGEASPPTPRVDLVDMSPGAAAAGGAFDPTMGL